MYFPPAGGGGVQRPLKFATHLPALGIETHVLAPDDPKWVHRDAELAPPTQAWIHRARYFGPRRAPAADDCTGRAGSTASRARRARSRGALLVPDENVAWNLTAIPAAIRIVRARADRRRADDVAAELGAPRRRGGQACDRRALGRRPARLDRRAPAPPRRAPARAREGEGRASLLRGSSRVRRTRSSPRPKRSPRRRARSSRAGRS